MNQQCASEFVPGLKLAEGFFREAVEPILTSHYHGMRYSAALIGSGSEVLGFDNEMSADHHWGPRVMLFLGSADSESKREGIRAILADELPKTYQGYSTNFSEPNPDDNGTQLLKTVTSGPVNHRVAIYTIEGFFAKYLNVDVSKKLSIADWLTLPQQRLSAVNAGRVFRDDLNLDQVRACFAWYPRDVWLYVLASLWKRIGQDEHLMGRAGVVGDENGSAIIGARLARDIMRLAFLMERQYPPYAKWFGTAFQRLRCAPALQPGLTKALHGTTWQEREAGLSDAYHAIAEIHNALGITDPVSSQVSPFFTRPFAIIHGDTFVAAILKRITDPEVLSLTKSNIIGSIDIFSDSTDFVDDEGAVRARFKGLYE